VSAETDGYGVYVDGKRHFTTADPWALAPEVKHWVLRLALEGFDHLLNIHAGVVAHRSGCLLLPGVQGSGKTTLTSALVRAGYRYFSDEVAPVLRGRCTIRAVPLGLCVKESGLDLIEQLLPGISGLPLYHRQDGLGVRYLPPNRPPFGALDGDAELPIRQVIFPRYRPGQGSRIERLSRIDGVRRLVQETVSIPRSLELEDVGCLVRHLEAVDFYDLTHDDLDEAIDRIRAVIGEAGA
jgi:hypothetical protein